MCSTQILLDRLEDMWTEESQLVGESVLAHDGFFLRSIGIKFYEVAEWVKCLFVGSYVISLQVK